MRRADLDESALRGLGQALGRQLRAGDVVLLCGVMGAGKTTLTRAIAQGLGLERPDRVCSPTFAICQHHRGSGGGGPALCHVDLFRLAGFDPDAGGPVGSAAFEALGLGELDELAEGAGPLGPSVLVVEWADLWAQPIPDALRVAIEVVPGEDPPRRTVHAEARGPRAAALLVAWSGDADAPPTADAASGSRA